LDLDRFLRTEEQRFTADMGPEGDPFLRNLAEGTETEHLEPAAVGQDPAIPVHKAVQPPCLPDDLVTRTEVEMVRIAQDDPAPDLLQLLRAHRLDGGLGAYRHEHRGFKGSVRGMEPSQTGSGLFAHLDQLITNSQEPRLPLVPLYLT